MQIPEWDVTVEVRSMSARQRAQMQNYVGDDDQTAGERQEALWGFLLTSCVYDPETGDPVFSDGDMEWLLEDKSFAVIDRLTSKCLSVSAVGADAVDDAGKDSSDSQTNEE
jgi:hypothetical protein